MADARDVQRVIEAARQVHGGLSGLLNLAERIQSGRTQYEEKHWGQPGKGRARDLPLPNVRTLIDMGELVSVVYLTRKGRDPELVEYEHDFSDQLPEEERDGTRPLLTFAGDGSGLVIVRGPSEYTVTKDGIEG